MKKQAMSNNVIKRNSTVLTHVVSILLLYCCIISCKKNWLDAKPDVALQIPATLEDYKSLLAGTTRGGSFNVNSGSLVEHSATDLFVNPTSLTNGPLIEKSFYSWEQDLWADPNYSNWIIPYQRIEYTNVVLEGIENIKVSTANEQRSWNEVKGTAYFFRGIWHYDVAKQFCVAYNKSSASTDLGIPLRLTGDFNVKSIRATVEQSYSQIISDLKSAVELLPIIKPVNDVYRCQPTKAAALGMLARIYISMNEFDSARVYSDKALQLYSTLLNYSTLSTSSSSPFPRFNAEVIFHMTGAAYSFLANGNGIPMVDTVLYNSYNVNDLRRSLFFRQVATNRFTFKNGYGATANAPFTGLCTDELLLIRAECNARNNNLTAALNDLNTLLITRWKNNGTWTPVVAASPTDALMIILEERRKELAFRCIRWTDLKRLNLLPPHQVTLTKIINGVPKTLSPNSTLYVFSIPPRVIELTGMPQNPR